VNEVGDKAENGDIVLSVDFGVVEKGERFPSKWRIPRSGALIPAGC
jgi:hypothetical protein